MERRLKPDMPPPLLRAKISGDRSCWRCGKNNWRMELHGGGQVVKVCCSCGRRVKSGK